LTVALTTNETSFLDSRQAIGNFLLSHPINQVRFNLINVRHPSHNLLRMQPASPLHEQYRDAHQIKRKACHYSVLHYQDLAAIIEDQLVDW
jgi:hypothetical protein